MLSDGAKALIQMMKSVAKSLEKSMKRNFWWKSMGLTAAGLKSLIVS